MSILANRKLLILVILALGFCAYSFILSAPFKTMDDNYSIIENPQIRSLQNLPSAFTSSFFGDGAYYRPLVTVSFMLEYHFFGLQPQAYYLTNIFLHLLNAVLVFFLIEAVTRHRACAFFVSLLFAVHPVYWEAVTNIPGRAILLCASFYFFSFYSFIRSRDGGMKYYVLSLAGFAGALLSKESAGMLPVLLVSYNLIIEQNRSVKNLIKRTGAFFLIAGAYVFWRQSIGITRIYYWRNIQECGLGFLSFLRSVFTHLRVMIAPYDLHFDRMQRVFSGLADVELWITVAAVIAVAVFVFRQRSRISPLAVFFLSWFAIDLVPVSQFLVSIGVQPGYIMTSEHFLYTASVGVFTVIVMAALKFYEINLLVRKASPGIILAGAGLILLGLYLTTLRQTIVSSGEVCMYEQTMRENPANTRIRTSLALAYAKMGMIPQAQENFAKVLSTDPQHVRARIGYGKTLCDQGHYARCVQEYEKVRDPGKLAGILKENMRQTYNVLIDQYRAVIRDDPANAQAYYSLGVAYQRTDRLRDAAEEYHHALLLKPDYKNALLNLAGCYQGMNDPIKALVYYQKLTQIPGEKDLMDLESYRQLAALYEKLGDQTSALNYQTMAEKFIKNNMAISH